MQRAWLRRGPLALALWPLSLLFGAAVSLRRLLYTIGVLNRQALPVPVIVVGNLVAGGAGKTPTVIAVAHALREAGYQPGVISRGYGRGDSGGRSADDAPVEVSSAVPVSQTGDEPLLIHLRTQAPLVVSRDRVAAGRALIERHSSVDVLVSDDGLQHLRMARDAQIIVFDERGAGNGWLLPAGPLREAVPHVLPERTLVLYNATSATTALPGALAQRSLAGIAPLAEWRNGAAPSLAAFDALRKPGEPVLAAAGMAHPQRFFSMLRALGLEISELALPDHHDYAILPWPPSTPDVIVTEKDAVKLAPGRMGSTRVWVATLDFALPPSFKSDLIALLPPPRTSR